MKKWWGKRGRIPRWHFSYWNGGRCKWYKRWQEWKKWLGRIGRMPRLQFPDNMEEGVSELKNDKSDKNDEVKGAEWPDVGAPLIKFLPYFAKTQLSLPRGKKIWVKGRQANPERRQIVPPWVIFSSPNRQYHPIIILPLRCRNSPSTSCLLYNRVIQLQWDIRSACSCIPWFFTQGLIKLNFVISSITMNVYSLSINPFLLLPIEWPYVYY